MENKNTITCKVYTLTAEDSQNEGDQHSWEIYELPTGEALDPGDMHADQWYDDVNSVEAYGLDFVVNVEDTGRTADFTKEDIKNSVNSSARSYGSGAIPESLRRYLHGLSDTARAFAVALKLARSTEDQIREYFA